MPKCAQGKTRYRNTIGNEKSGSYLYEDSAERLSGESISQTRHKRIRSDGEQGKDKQRVSSERNALESQNVGKSLSLCQSPEHALARSTILQRDNRKNNNCHISTSINHKLEMSLP
jgi:hypothetical protein